MSDKVKVVINGNKVLVNTGTRLSDLLDIEKPCGGKGTCGKCKVKVNEKEELACKYIINSNIQVETYKQSKIISETGIQSSGKLTENLCFALDIGTTTIALALVSIDEKRVVKVLTSTNPQRKFGADVITRIEHCQKNGVKDLHEILVAEINNMIAQFGVNVERAFVCANVTMLHAFFGVDCASIGIAPYTPAFLEGKTVSAQTIGIKGVETIISLPSISSFVGADIVAGLNLIGMPEDDKFNLLIDLGTNAEVVLYSKTFGVATAAAAGPCFEGANISCGMSAINGAICAFKFDGDCVKFTTINDEIPIGICGTGLIDVISELVKKGIIDQTGYMEDDYVIYESVHLSAKDVRQFQLAKSAVYSAILALMKIANVSFENLSTLYLSGGFSAKINILSAINSGLIPKELGEKTVVLSNSSLQGAVKYACGNCGIQQFIDTIKYIDLSSNAYFSQQFMENMAFDVDCL